MFLLEYKYKWKYIDSQVGLKKLREFKTPLTFSGDGEIRTLVLFILHISDYTLIQLFTTNKYLIPILTSLSETVSGSLLIW